MITYFSITVGGQLYSPISAFGSSPPMVNPVAVIVPGTILGSLTFAPSYSIVANATNYAAFAVYLRARGDVLGAPSTASTSWTSGTAIELLAAPYTFEAGDTLWIENLSVAPGAQFSRGGWPDPRVVIDPSSSPFFGFPGQLGILTGTSP